MRISTHKLDAKRIVSQSPAKSREAALIALLPRVFAAISVSLLTYFYNDKTITLVALIFSVVVLLFFLNSIFIPTGNLLLCSLMFEEVLGTSTDYGVTFKTALSLLRKYGFIKLIKLRFTMLIRIAKDAAAGALPPLILAAFILLYFGTRQMPIGAAITVAVGILSMTLLATARVVIEYSKYNFVYLQIFLYAKPEESIQTTFKEAIKEADLRMKSIFIMELSFLLRELYSVVLMFPLPFLSAYKKLTLFSVGATEPAPQRKSAYERICEKYAGYSKKKKEIKEIHMSDTVVFNIKE